MGLVPPEQFLEALSAKAGLPPKAYRDPDAAMYVYSVQVFAQAGPAGAKALPE